MDASLLIQQLETDADRFRVLVSGVSIEQARWKPDPQTWSMLEIVCHLHDEEKLDFRVRIDAILHHPGEEPPQSTPRAGFSRIITVSATCRKSWMVSWLSAGSQSIG